MQAITDRFGVWPICWCLEENRLAFSDRADSVPSSHPREVEPQALFDYLYFHMIPAPRTIYRGVQRLAPATRLQFDGTAVVLQSTWQPQFASHRTGSVGELTIQFRGLIRQSVEFEAAHPSVGCFLSGGTDSSTVAGTLKQMTGQARTFSIGFDQHGYDEMHYARIAARHFGTDHCEHYVTPEQLVAAMPQVASHFDQPFGNSSALPAFICARIAREHGVSKVARRRRWRRTFWRQLPIREAEALRILVVAAFRASPGAQTADRERLYSSAFRCFARAASYVDQASVPMPSRLETYNLLLRFGAANVLQRSVSRSSQRLRTSFAADQIYALPQGASFVDRMLAYDWRFTLADNDLPKVTGAAQLAGVAVGFPLLSDGLVDLSLRLAPRDKVQGTAAATLLQGSADGLSSARDHRQAEARIRPSSRRLAGQRSGIPCARARVA